MIELVLLAPWIFFLFTGAVDCGFYCYALISVESAARVAALHASTDATSAVDQTTACTYTLNELKYLPNVGSGTTSCSASPVIVNTQVQNGSDGSSAALVSVTYRNSPLIPIPGLLQNNFTWTRTVMMRLRG